MIYVYVNIHYMYGHVYIHYVFVHAHTCMMYCMLYVYDHYVYTYIHVTPLGLIFVSGVGVQIHCFAWTFGFTMPVTVF